MIRVSRSWDDVYSIVRFLYIVRVRYSMLCMMSIVVLDCRWVWIVILMHAF